MRRSRILLILMLCLGGTAIAGHRFDPQIGSIRCGNDLVSIGDDAYHLLETCGDPDFRQVVQYGRQADRVTARDGQLAVTFEDAAYVVTEEWVYKQGPGRLVKILTLTRGVVADIRVSGRQ